jgi:hypothetical protein
MLSNFYVEGGWGMFPVTIIGLAFLAACARYAFRPDPRHARLAAILGFVTVAAGVLGATTGFCATFLYLQKVDHAQQFEIAALGMQESLHNVTLSLVLGILGGLGAAVGTLREKIAARA